MNAFSVGKSCVLVVNYDKKVFCEGQKDKKMNFRENGLWLMSELDFMPDVWGGIGFHEARLQNRIARRGTIVAIYNVRDSDNEDSQGMVVSFVELSGEMGNIRQFVCNDTLEERLAIEGNENRWRYAVEISRAWMVARACWQDVEDIFSNTYENRRQGRDIGTNGRMVESQNNFNLIENLIIEPVRVYPQVVLPPEHEEPAIRTAGALLRIRGVLDE